MRHIVGCCIALAALSCSGEPGPATEAEGASAEIVRSMCAAREDYVLACAVDTDGFDDEACNLWFAKYYRRDVIESFQRCYTSQADSCQAGDCASRAVVALELALEQNLDDPLVRACSARFADCNGASKDSPASGRCAGVLLYTEEGRERVAHCYTETVSCSSTTECTRFPDGY